MDTTHIARANITLLLLVRDGVCAISAMVYMVPALQFARGQ